MRLATSLLGVCVIVISACRASPGEGQFACDPLTSDPCPHGYVCVDYGTQNLCFTGLGICGNGIMEPGEQCDGLDFGDGTDIGPANVRCDQYDDEIYRDEVPGCQDNCLVACSRCGDNVADTQFGEECDNGGMNGWAPDACRPGTCTLPSCGDGVVDHAELCEEFHEDLYGVECDSACQFPCRPGYVGIPGGPFEMGCNDGDQVIRDEDWCELAEGPQHTVTLSPFCMQQTEVHTSRRSMCPSPFPNVRTGGIRVAPTPQEATQTTVLRLEAGSVSTRATGRVKNACMQMLAHGSEELTMFGK